MGNTKITKVSKPVHRRVQLEVKVQDLWIGAFWQKSLQMPVYQGFEPLPEKEIALEHFDLWVCLLPCLPLHYSHERVLDLEREDY